jgi:hypothetical protein
MKKYQLNTMLGLALAASAAQAAGPLYLTEGDNPQPLHWNTSAGPIPVWTDGGEAYAYDFDGVTPFITIERANQITEYAFSQWNAVSTSTFEAHVTGSFADRTNGAITDITGENAEDVYAQENGYGIWVNYDTDGSIISDFFGAGTGVLGIAFPEWADEQTGEITEATAVLNGNAIWEGDPNGDIFAAVFTHEFGHAINLSHSQVNGDLFYAQPYQNRQAGAKGCGPFPSLSSFEEIETMFPFISVYQDDVGVAVSTVNLTDDIVAISNLYPTSEYASDYGSISGTLYLKDGKTEYSGINVIARNVNNWYGDAVSAMTGDQTQGQVGPDGSYTINGLTPGAEYVVYISDIWQGGYPTTPMPIVSVGEYWNTNESSDPITDDVCEATPIQAVAGSTAQADIVFNGYVKGIQYTPIVSAFLTDLSKNGKKSAGIVGSTAFVWDENRDFIVLGGGVKANNGQMSRNGDKMTVQFDYSGNDIQQSSLFDFRGKKAGSLVSNGDLNFDSCGGSSSNGINSSSGFAVDDDGKTVVGLSYVDIDNDGQCQTQRTGEILPFIWDAKYGHRELDTSGVTWGWTYPFIRAHAISGNGRVVLGGAGSSRAVAWVDEGPMIDLRDSLGAYEAYAVSRDGSRVAVSTSREGVKLWNPYTDAVEEIGGLRWCRDLPYSDFLGRDLCATYGEDFINQQLGPIPVVPADMNDDGSVIIGRGGSFRTGLVGAIWLEGIGWMNLKDFFLKQGVTEAFEFPMDNPISIDGSGSKMVGGLAGITFSWHVDMQQVYVCVDGQSVQVGFPNGLRNAIEEGAEFGRCEFLDF